MKPACTSCGYIHTTTDARAIARFAGTPSYVAANAGTPPRATRAEAEADECAWRQANRDHRGDAAALHPDATGAQALTVDGGSVERGAGRTPPAAPPPEPFPAALMETAARAKAWRDFLAETQMSLMVWQLDASVRAGCEDVRAWLRRCRDELAELVPS